jgi:predicted SnoaL-like aldol condensation-catalyzing enzyme
MTDGTTIASDLDRTEANKALIRSYMDGLVTGRQTLAAKGSAVKYDRVHRVLGEGNFVLVASEGSLGARPTAHYDLYRIESGKIAAHWDTMEAIPPRADWKNPNGKF